MEREAQIFLICTVGGSPAPVVASIAHWRPVRIRFVHSPETKGEIDGKIVPEACGQGINLDPGRYDFFALPDAQDFAECVSRLRALTPDVQKWVDRGDAYGVVVDFTGGTKCMSAALAVHARRWPCRFSYVGGTKRDKGDVGVIISGAEMVVHSANPWDALGYQAVEEFMVLFDQRAFAAAAQIAEKTKGRVDRKDRKEELNVLEQLARAFDAWDRFDHRTAAQYLGDVKKRGNDLRAALGDQRGDRVLETLERLERFLRELCEATLPNQQRLRDLLANAQRRREEGRFDDAVARLYRAIEGAAQLRLAEAHGLDNTGRVPLECVPGDLRKRFEPRAEEGHVTLGLQDAYALLEARKDPLGEMFRQEGLHEPESILSTRNRSILAHGFDPIGEAACNRLWRAALKLTGITESELPEFPKLSDRL